MAHSANRHYHTPSLVNYGAIPQTWEDPTVLDMGHKGVVSREPLLLSAPLRLLRLLIPLLPSDTQHTLWLTQDHT